jgi:hypothetical protein
VPLLSDLRRDELAYYRICVLGVLDAGWSSMLSNMQVTIDERCGQPSTTTLCGLVVDQAALMGVLNLVYDLGMVLLTVERQEAI